MKKNNDIDKADNIQVVNNLDMSRLEIRLGEEIALIDYILRKDRILFLHTEVPGAMQGRGLAGKMAKAALEYAREHKLTVTSLCAYMDIYLVFLDRNPKLV